MKLDGLIFDDPGVEDAFRDSPSLVMLPFSGRDSLLLSRFPALVTIPLSCHDSQYGAQAQLALLSLYMAGLALLSLYMAGLALPN
eukprot:10662192-Karenia_brevis.AAC.1